ncbi:MAG: hypothetical protein ACI9C1_000774 [Candidatus Aldehydirespiratoraceae bacterium]|jgi:hypothetical protein
MSKPTKTFTTKSGKTFTEAELTAMAEGLAEREYTDAELTTMKKTRRRTPRLGDTVTKPSSYRIPDRLKTQLKKRAKTDKKSESDVVRDALDAYLGTN